MTLKEQVLSFMKEKSYFQLNENGENEEILNFETRLHGDAFRNKPGEEDLEHAEEMEANLKQKFKGLEVFYDCMEEWVCLEVSFKEV